MGPTRIMMIRHAEEHATPGFTSDGRGDHHSLTARGWQRAGALAQFFRASDGRGSTNMTPDVVYASAIGPGSESRRPRQTVSPLVDKLGEGFLCDAFLKPDAEGLMADVMTRSGTVLIAWEHSRIPHNAAALPGAPRVPSEWPKDRYDLVWVFDRAGQGWTFAVVAQMLLAGDAGAP